MAERDIRTNMEIMGTLAGRVKAYRLAARLSQREMARLSGVSYTTICHFEQGLNPNLTLNNLLSMLRVLGMEERMADVLPELPFEPLVLREINKLIPKRVRRAQHK